jgi:hypothetical protein
VERLEGQVESLESRLKSQGEAAWAARAAAARAVEKPLNLAKLARRAVELDAELTGTGKR